MNTMKHNWPILLMVWIGVSLIVWGSLHYSATKDTPKPMTILPALPMSHTWVDFQVENGLIIRMDTEGRFQVANMPVFGCAEVLKWREVEVADGLLRKLAEETL